MKKILFILFISLFFIGGIQAQTIETRKMPAGYQFLQNDKVLNMRALNNALEKNEEAHELFQSAKPARGFSQFLGGAGGFLIGYPVGTAIAGGEPKWVMAAIGAGLIVIAIPISLRSGKKIVRAVEIYNQEEGATSLHSVKPYLELGADVNGFGLRMNF